MSNLILKKYISELIGTYFLVFIGTGSIIVNNQFNNLFGLTGIAISFGLIITAIIYIFGNISGAHINPAVSLGLLALKKISIKDSLFYIIFQITGAILASFTLKILFPSANNLGETLVTGSLLQSFISEFVLTAIMMFTILGVSSNQNTSHLTGLVVGFVIIALIFVGGPISGGSFNPARSIGPALLNLNFENLWLYIISPIFGSIIAVLIWHFLNTK
jgi:aquaporin Z